MPAPDAPTGLDVVVVASWFPSLVDPVQGRFVADQVAAVLAAGEVRPVVVSFDPAVMAGSQRQRSDLATIILGDTRRAVETGHDIFAPAGLGGPPGVPVARLPVPEGRSRTDPVLHAVRYREVVLDALAERWLEAPLERVSLPPRPVLVHAHTGYPDGAAAAALAARLGVPLLITEHASFLASLLSRPAVREAYVTAARVAARLIAVSEVLGSELRQALPEVADRVVVVPNAIPVDDFPTVPMAERRAGELLYVGHRTEAKGIPLLLLALARVRERRPDVTLRLIGQAPHATLEARWLRLAAQVGVADAVTFEAPTDRTGVAAAMGRASIFVHGSRRETFGVVAAEALAAGLPVVATDSGGVTEILGPDPTAMGALVPPDDPVAMAAAIEALLEHRAAFDALRARASITDRYGARSVARRLVALYGTALEEHGSGAGTVAHGRPHPPATRSVATPDKARAVRPPAVLLALDPDRARLAERLPAEARERLVVVTSAARDGPRRAAFGDVVTVALGRRARTTADAAALASTPLGRSRLGAGLRHPLALARRRGLLPGTEHLIRTRGPAGLRTALERTRQMGDAPGGHPIVVCADGLDHLAARELARTGEITVAPGGIRWLGDRAASEASDRPAGGPPATLGAGTDRTREDAGGHDRE